MIVKQNWKWMIPILVILAVAMTGSVWARGSAGDFDDAWGRRFDDQSQFRDSSRDQTTRNGNDAINRLRYWNEIAINTSGLDHTPWRRVRAASSGSNWVPGDQAARWRSSRSECLMQLMRLSAGIEATPVFLRSPAAPPSMRPLHRRRTIR